MDIKLQKKNWVPLLLFCTTAGLATTLWGYNYYAGNAEEQLPFIFRAMDPAYLTRDFFTNTFLQYGPRTIFSEFIAFLARFAPLATVLFLLTLIGNISIAFISARTAQFFFKDSKFSAFLAAVGVLTIKTFWLGYSNILYRTFLEPEHLAMPLILLGFYFILQKKFIGASLFFGLAALFHPLLGLETGWLLLGISFLVLLIQVFRREGSLHNGKSLFIGGLILACFSVGLLLPYAFQESIPSDVFINLIAYVRHPHHYLPSTFELWQYGQAAVYLSGFCFIFWFALKRSDILQIHKIFLLLTGGAIVLLCLSGYIFVEIWPIRIFTAAQLFRLPYLIKWFSIVLMAGWVGNIIEQPAENEPRFFGLIAGISLVTPVSVAFVALALWARKVILPRLKLPVWLLHDGVILVLSIIAIIIYSPEFRTISLYMILFGMVWIMFWLHWRGSGLMVATTLSLAVAGIFILFATIVTPPVFLKYEVPVFSLFRKTGETVEMANYAKANTPTDALFLTLPKFGEFRYLADRAIVVDLVAYPFQDTAMLEWRNRMADCYGVADQWGFDALPELNSEFHSVTDDKILLLAEKYGIDYAVVYDDTITNFPIIFRTTSLKMIKIVR